MQTGAPLAPLLVVLVVLVLSHFWNRGLVARYDYRCDQCDSTFSLSPWVATIAPHRFGGLKYVKCPRCGQYSWAEPVEKSGL